MDAEKKFNPAAHLAASAVSAGFGFLGGNILAQVPGIAQHTDNLIQTLQTIFAAHSFGISPEAIPMYIGACSAFVAFGVAFFGKKDEQFNDVHGNARFANKHELEKYAHTSEVIKYGKEKISWPKPWWCECLDDDNILVADGVKISLSKNPVYENEVPNRHGYMLAGSGSGKTYGFIQPNALQCNGSFAFTDPKAELFHKLAPFLKNHGYKIKYLDLRGGDLMRHSMCYNPLAYVTQDTEITQLVDMFITNTSPQGSNGSDQFFTSMEKNIYSCLLNYFFFYFGQQGNMADCNMPNMLDYLALAKKEKNTSALDLVFYATEKEDGFMGYREWLIESVCHGDIKAAQARREWTPITNYEAFTSSDSSPETRASIVASCYARLRDFANADVARLLSKDELELDRFGKDKYALFLILPDGGGGTFRFLASMVLNQLFHINMLIADNSETGHLDIPIQVFMDECANIGKIPELAQLISTTRSRWINLFPIFQNKAQAEAVYGDKEAETLYSNAALTLYYGNSGVATAEFLSKQIGFRTIWRSEQSHSYSGQGTSVSNTRHPYKVPLIDSSELQNEHFKNTEALTHFAGTSWYRGFKLDPTKHPRWKERCEAQEEFDKKIRELGLTSPVEAWATLYPSNISDGEIKDFTSSYKQAYSTKQNDDCDVVSAYWVVQTEGEKND